MQPKTRLQSIYIKRNHKQSIPPHQSGKGQSGKSRHKRQKSGATENHSNRCSEERKREDR